MDPERRIAAIRMDLLRDNPEATRLYYDEAEFRPTQVQEWRLASETSITRHKHERQLAAMASHNSDFGAMTLSEVRDLVARTRTRADRAATLATVIEYIREGGGR